MKICNSLGLSACLLASMAASAIAASCPTTGTVQDLLNTGSAGCSISVGGGASLTFSNFTFTPSGIGTPAANAVGYTLDDPGTGPGGTPIWGFEFNPGLSVAGTSASPNNTQDILLNYLEVASGTGITSIHLLQNAAVTGSGVAQTTENLMFCIASDPNNTSGTCRNFGGNPLHVTTATNTSTDDRNVAPWTSMFVSKNIDAASITAGSTATISQVRDSVDVTAAIPEPATYSLLGIGLAAFGYFARRRKA